MKYKYEDSDGNLWDWIESKNHKLTKVKVGYMTRKLRRPLGAVGTRVYSKNIWGVMTPEGFIEADENHLGSADKKAQEIRRKRIY